MAHGLIMVKFIEENPEIYAELELKVKEKLFGAETNNEEND